MTEKDKGAAATPRLRGDTATEGRFVSADAAEEHDCHKNMAMGMDADEPCSTTLLSMSPPTQHTPPARHHHHHSKHGPPPPQDKTAARQKTRDKLSIALDAHVKRVFADFENFRTGRRAQLCADASVSLRYRMSDHIARLLRHTSAGDGTTPSPPSTTHGKKKTTPATPAALAALLLADSTAFKRKTGTVVNGTRENIEKVSGVFGILSLTCSTIPALVVAGPGGALLAVAAKEAVESGARVLLTASLAGVASAGQAEAWFWNLEFVHCGEL